MNIRTILKYLIYATAFIPLVIFSQYISPFHFGKVIVFRSLVEIMLVLYLYLVARDSSYRPRVDKFFWAFLAFTAIYTLTALTSINVYQSFWGTLERMGGVYSFWHYFIFYIILTSTLKTKDEWVTFLKITVGVGVLSAFYGFGQRTNLEFFIGSGGRERIFGTIGNAALFAGYQILNVFIALILGVESTNKRNRNILFASAGIMVLAVFMTAVRGSLLGLSVGLLLFVFLYFSQTSSKLAKKILLSLLGLVIVFVGFSFAFKDSSVIQNSRYLKRVTDFSPTNYTVQTRFWAWQAGLKGWSESPQKMMLGWGPENFNVPFSKHFNPLFFRGPGSETLFDRAHNMFVEVLVTTGLLGLIAYLGIFFVIFKSLWRLRDNSKFRVVSWGLMSMTVAYMIHNAFIFDTSANLLVFFSVFGFMSYICRADDDKPKSVKAGLVSSGVANLLFVVLLIVLLFVIYQTNIKTAKANRSTTYGIVTGWSGDFTGALGYYNKATSYNVAGRYEYRNRFAQYLLDYSAEKVINSPEAMEAFKYAISLEEKNAEENPQDYLPELYLSRLNIILGKSDPKSPYNDEAMRHALKALSYSPTFVRTYYEVGQVYLNKKDYPNAILQFEKAIELNPKVGISYWYLGAVEMQYGQVEKALAHMTDAIDHGYSVTESDYLSLAGTYIKRNDFPHLVRAYEGLVKINPKNPQYLASLAVAYSKVGRIDEAVVAARLAAQVDPSFELDARRFVEQLGRVW